MSIGFKHSKVRLTLLATMVAATSAFVAAPVQAGKAPPVFTDDSIVCRAPGGNVVATFAVAGKGKWVFLDVELVVDGIVNPWLGGHKEDRTKTIEFNTSVPSANKVAMKATLVDRKGVPYEDPRSAVVTDTVPCP